MYFALAANEGFKLRSIDIRVAFLQAKGLDREVYMEPLKDVKKEGKILKLKKPLYGLNDANHKYELWILDGDEAFYFRHDENGNLEGMISSHVDDFILAGTEKF